jgi:hypothetical protein
MAYATGFDPNPDLIEAGSADSGEGERYSEGKPNSIPG